MAISVKTASVMSSVMTATSVTAGLGVVASRSAAEEAADGGEGSRRSARKSATSGACERGVTDAASHH